MLGDMATGPQGQAEIGAVASVRKPWLGLGVLMVVYVLNFTDRQILAILIEPIRREIPMSDTQIGLLTGTLFAVFYSIITIPFAMMADRVNRVRIVAAACFLWSLFTGLSGLATSFAVLAIARIGVAFGEAGGVAPSLSILGDYFPPKKRAFAIAIFTTASPIGILVGTLIGGLAAAAFGWRSVFIAAGVIGILVVPVLLLLTPEPVRGTYEKGGRIEGKPPSLWFTIKLFFQFPTLGWMAASCGLFAMAANALITWMPALLMRTYGMSVQQVALYYGPMVGSSLMLGLLLSGSIVTRFAKRTPKAYALVPAVAMLVCAPTFAAALLSPTWQVALLLLFIPVALINFVVPPALTLVQNLAPANARSTASALLMLVLNLVGIGLGPLLVGAVSDAVSANMGATGLRFAMIATMAPIMLANAGTLFIASRYVKRDQAKVGQ